MTRMLTALVFVAAVIGFLATYRLYNDHFDRLARAAQIARFGAVPFRDFFDPGYFFTLYASAAMERVFGDNLLGELLLNVLCLAAGTTLVFRLAGRTSGSITWGLVAAGLVLMAEPRAYDYDKVLFFTLGLAACWRYADEPTWTALLGMAGVTAIATLFRYDNGVYLGAAAVAAIVVRHGRAWRTIVSHVAGLATLVGLALAPGLIFIERTAGLGDAARQIATYAAREGARTGLLRLFQVRAAIPSTTTGVAAGASYSISDLSVLWLHGLAVVLPLAVLGLDSLSRRPRSRGVFARRASFVALAELVAFFVLREPVAARIGGVMPVIAIGGGCLVGALHHASGVPAGVTPSTRRRLLGGAAMVMLATTIASIGVLFEWPPASNFDAKARLALFATTPPALELWPIKAFTPLVKYLRDCTDPDDRVLVGWFGGEVSFFSGRGFAAGMPVVFGDHWSEMRYERRALALLQAQSVPLVLVSAAESLRRYPLLWDFIEQRYRMVDATGDGLASTTIWARRDRPVARPYGQTGLPCYSR